MNVHNGDGIVGLLYTLRLAVYACYLGRCTFALVVLLRGGHLAGAGGGSSSDALRASLLGSMLNRSRGAILTRMSLRLARIRRSILAITAGRWHVHMSCMR